ncbi:hypothetical protein [Hymenobacter negativus]|uniref:GNAT family N-acetyltransferase n=1 Tax=Hymenobacter negativus TaxID=2795026 RepID=A0ABS3QL98_9BACT|nr:hypothetical protein [Hymenobacter negativus]MBO2012002.1 hypothetical protein [Hymenobacter negativus]
MSDFGLEITPRPDLPAIIARWQREISEPELQRGYLAILAAGDALGCWRWLLDLRRREELASPALTLWLDTSFFPQLVGRYVAPVRMAFLISPLRATQQQASVGLAGAVSAPSAAYGPEQSYQSGLFTDEAAAYHWLAQ